GRRRRRRQRPRGRGGEPRRRRRRSRRGRRGAVPTRPPPPAARAPPRRRPRAPRPRGRGPGRGRGPAPPRLPGAPAAAVMRTPFLFFLLSWKVRTGAAPHIGRGNGLASVERPRASVPLRCDADPTERSREGRACMTEPDVEILPSAYGLAFPLAWVAGYVDAVGFLTLAGLFVAHMSGNTVRLGVFLGDGDWSLAAQRFVPIVVFTLGVIAGIALCEALSRRSIPVPARVLGIEAVLLLVFMLVGRALLGSDSAPAGSWDYYLLAIVAVLAMGLQNVALRRVAGLPIHTTFVTGMLTYVGEEVVNGWYARRGLRRAGVARHRD